MMKIRTEQLKALVTKANVGAGNDKLIPLTQFIHIKKSGNAIATITTDATNYLYVYDKIEEDTDDFTVTAYIETFAKLVSKLTSEFTKLEVKDGILEVVSNGKYSIELPLDENGEAIDYPDPYPTEVEYDGTIAIADIKKMNDTVRASLANTMELPVITNYYVGDKVVATDRYKIAYYNKKLVDNNVLMSNRLVELLNLMTEDIKYHIEDDYMVFNTFNCEVYTKSVDDVKQYPIQVIDAFAGEEYEDNCMISKADIMPLLDRMSLFVGAYDDKSVRLYFEPDGLRVASKDRHSDESVLYADTETHKDYDCVIDIDMLTTQLKAYKSDIVHLYYGNPKSIKLVDGDITQIIALMQ